MDESGVAFVSDVGAAKLLENSQKSKEHQSISKIGTLKWMAPELRLRMVESENENVPVDILKSDTFSLGLVALQTLDYKVFKAQEKLNKHPIKLINYLRTLRFNHPRKKIRLEGEIPREKVPLGFYYFLRCMLSFDIHTRPSVEELYKDKLKLIS